MIRSMQLQSEPAYQSLTWSPHHVAVLRSIPSKQGHRSTQIKASRFLTHIHRLRHQHPQSPLLVLASSLSWTGDTTKHMKGSKLTRRGPRHPKLEPFVQKYYKKLSTGNKCSDESRYPEAYGTCSISAGQDYLLDNSGARSLGCQHSPGQLTA